jgi:hypothetical protein
VLLQFVHRSLICENPCFWREKGWSVCGLRVLSVKNIVFGGVVCSDYATGCEGCEHDHDSHGQKSSISMKVLDF